MEKYAVVLDKGKTKTAADKKYCPQCSGELDLGTYCPRCGTEPFEEKPLPKKDK